MRIKLYRKFLAYVICLTLSMQSITAFAQEVTQDNLSGNSTHLDIPVTASVAATFTVSLPTNIELIDNSGVQQYSSNVGVKGDIEAAAKIKVASNDSVTLFDVSNRPEENILVPKVEADQSGYAHKTPVNASIAQTNTIWSSETLASTSHAIDSGLTYNSEDGFHYTPLNIAASGLSAGKWEGTITFDIGYCNGIDHHFEDRICQVCGFEIPEEPGLYSRTWTMSKSWNDLVNEGIVHVTDGVVTTNYNEDSHTNTSKDLLVGNLVVDNSVTSVGDSAFINCSNMTSVTLPNTINSIEQYAFCGCSKLKTVNMPEELESIKNNAFMACSSLEYAKIPDSVSSMGTNAFSSCLKLKNIDIPASLENIPDYAFGYCTSIKTLEIPNTVKSIGVGAFQGCNNITELTIPEGVTTIGGNAFVQLSIEEVSIPSSITSFDAGVFGGCRNLKTVTFNDGCTTIFAKMFMECGGLETVNIPDSVTSIGQLAFFRCNNLTVHIPKSVTSIGANAFVDVPHIYYSGTATGSPWGAKAIN